MALQVFQCLPWPWLAGGRVKDVSDVWVVGSQRLVVCRLEQRDHTVTLNT